ncbi:hypothetical protein HG530_005771 [Fusarium avenaceum]|nr:hypothetical protein HG530_005771 [Fusarium avenaceum]
MGSHNFASPNHPDSPTLYEALTTANRPLHYKHTAANARIDTRTVYPNIRMTVVHWDGFNIESLKQAYDDILSSSLDIQIRDSDSKSDEINTLKQLKLACEKDILQPICQALVKGTNFIAGRLLQATPNVEIIVDDHFPSNRGYVSGLSLRSSDNASNRTARARLVMSCFYCASAWRSDRLRQHSRLALIPLRRLAWYCLESNTRYGFIFTDEELVVMRVSAVESVRSWASCQVEWKSISLSDSGPNVLTAKLSLWFLTMMSLHEDYRTICAPGQLLPVNRWWRHRDCNRKVVFQHHLSMRQVAKEPADADVEDMNLIL